MCLSSVHRPKRLMSHALHACMTAHKYAQIDFEESSTVTVFSTKSSD